MMAVLVMITVWDPQEPESPFPQSAPSSSSHVAVQLILADIYDSILVIRILSGDQLVALVDPAFLHSSDLPASASCGLRSQGI